MTLAEQIFAGLFVLFAATLFGVFWKRMDYLQGKVDGMVEEGKELAALQATVAGQAQLMELARLQNETAHKFLADQIATIGTQVLAVGSKVDKLKGAVDKMNGGS